MNFIVVVELAHTLIPDEFRHADVGVSVVEGAFDFDVKFAKNGSQFEVIHFRAAFHKEHGGEGHYVYGGSEEPRTEVLASTLSKPLTHELLVEFNVVADDE